MRSLPPVLAAFALVAGCASAVSDSLARRGQSPDAVAGRQIDAAGRTASRLAVALADAGAAAETLGAAHAGDLGRRASSLDAACSTAAREAQTLRIGIDTMRAAARRGFADREIAAQNAPAAARESERIAADRARFDRVAEDFDRASHAADSAVSACGAEARYAIRNPNAAAVAARRAERAAFTARAAAARAQLDAAASAARAYLAL